MRLAVAGIIVFDPIASSVLVLWRHLSICSGVVFSELARFV